MSALAPTAAGMQVLALLAATGSLPNGTGFATRFSLERGGMIERRTVAQMAAAMDAGLPPREFQITETGARLLLPSPLWRAMRALEDAGYEVDPAARHLPGRVLFRRVGTTGRIRAIDSAYISQGSRASIYVPAPTFNDPNRTESVLIYPPKEPAK